jgi:thiamine kinase-like enzyme
LGVEANAVYLEDVRGQAQEPAHAARHLAVWQSTTVVPQAAWLCADQLAQRLKTTEVDWTAVDADPRAAEMWDLRWDWMDTLSTLPRVLSHGDYSLGNLIARGDDTIVVDWATLGVAPVGADLAHLALSALCDPTEDYLAVAREHWRPEDVVLGYSATLAIVAASRMHWMLLQGVPIPNGYLDFVWGGDRRSSDIAERRPGGPGFGTIRRYPSPTTWSWTYETMTSFLTLTRVSVAESRRERGDRSDAASDRGVC